MKIQRYSIRNTSMGIAVEYADDAGVFVHLHDHVADKAAAVEEAQNEVWDEVIDACGGGGYDESPTELIIELRDKLDSSAEKTAELRAELVTLLKRDACKAAFYQSDGGWITLATVGKDWPEADRLAELGEWERMWSGTRYHYRPIEPRSSGGSDDEATQTR